MGFDDGRNQSYWSHRWSQTSDIANVTSDSNCGVDGRFIWNVGEELIISFTEGNTPFQ